MYDDHPACPPFYWAGLPEEGLLNRMALVLVKQGCLTYIKTKMQDLDINVRGHAYHAYHSYAKATEDKRLQLRRGRSGCAL